MEIARAQLFALLIALVVFSGQNCQADDSDEKKFVAFCSTTQIADFTRQVVGDRWDVQCVLAPGQDPHLYEPTTNDTAAARKADLCLQNGLHLEGGNWMETLANTADKKLVSCTDRTTDCFAVWCWNTPAGLPQRPNGTGRLAPFRLAVPDAPKCFFRDTRCPH